MPGKHIRAAIAGASSLLGKELAEQLNASAAAAWDIALLDSGEAPGKITSAGDEPIVIQAIDASAFQGLDVVFFAGNADTTREHWRAAAKAGASIVDLTGALERQPGVTVRCPWMKPAGPADSPALDLATIATVSAHPAAIMLGVVLERLHGHFQTVHAAATVLEPASQQGSAGLDEMHGQTVSLLSFQSVPKDVFDAQVAFNLSASLGGSARADLAISAQRIREHMGKIAGAAVAKSCAMQLIQAPVFNGYTASVFVKLGETADLAHIERAVAGGLVNVSGPDDPFPSNISATEQDEVLVQLSAALNEDDRATGVWLWMAVDNLRLAARNAVACAFELLALRPGGRVQ